MTTLHLERILPVEPGRVWVAFTTASELAAWLWPASWDTRGEVDLRVGGHYRVASPVAGIAVSGEYLEIDAPRRLVQTWQWDGDDTASVVTISLHPEHGGTRLTIDHTQLADDRDREQHAQGWNDCLERLPAHLGI